MNASSWVATAAGAGLLVIVAMDIYRTILHSRARSGPITEALTRSVWCLARAAAFRRSRSNRHRLLSHVVRVPKDLEEGWREYLRRRHGWERELAGFALHLGYGWNEVSGDGDLRVAAG
jgi:hypothetical protein